MWETQEKDAVYNVLKAQSPHVHFLMDIAITTALATFQPVNGKIATSPSLVKPDMRPLNYLTEIYAVRLKTAERLRRGDLSPTVCAAAEMETGAMLPVVTAVTA